VNLNVCVLETNHNPSESIGCLSFCLYLPLFLSLFSISQSAFDFLFPLLCLSLSLSCAVLETSLSCAVLEGSCARDLCSLLCCHRESW